MLLCFSSYALACFWFWYANTIEEENSDDLNFDSYFEKMDKTPEERKMLTVWYFMITTLTTVGYGDLFPVSTNEYAVLILILIIGVAFFAYVIGVIHNLIISISVNEEADFNMEELTKWLDMIESQFGTIPPDMKTEILRHYLFYW